MKTTEVAKRTGASYRQLDEWARTGVMAPAQRAAMGSGVPREYSNAQVEVIALMVDLMHTLPGVRPALAAAVALEAHVTGRTQLTGALVAVEVLKR